MRSISSTHDPGGSRETRFEQQHCMANLKNARLQTPAAASCKLQNCLKSLNQWLLGNSSICSKQYLEWMLCQQMLIIVRICTCVSMVESSVTTCVVDRWTESSLSLHNNSRTTSHRRCCESSGDIRRQYYVISMQQYESRLTLD